MKENKKYTCNVCKGKKIIEDDNTVVHMSCNGDLEENKKELSGISGELKEEFNKFTKEIRRKEGRHGPLYVEFKDIEPFISEQIEKAYLRGFEENKEAYVKEVERRAYQKGLHENTSGVIEHCSIPDCPECNMEAYNAGYDKSQEEIGVALRNFVDKLKKGLLNE